MQNKSEETLSKYYKELSEENKIQPIAMKKKFNSDKEVNVRSRTVERKGEEKIVVELLFK